MILFIDLSICTFACMLLVFTDEYHFISFDIHSPVILFSFDQAVQTSHNMLFYFIFVYYTYSF